MLSPEILKIISEGKTKPTEELDNLICECGHKGSSHRWSEPFEHYSICADSDKCDKCKQTKFCDCREFKPKDKSIKIVCDLIPLRPKGTEYP